MVVNEQKDIFTKHTNGKRIFTLPFSVNQIEEFDHVTVSLYWILIWSVKNKTVTGFIREGNDDKWSKLGEKKWDDPFQIIPWDITSEKVNINFDALQPAVKDPNETDRLEYTFVVHRR